jgi:hypothetical protein
MTYELIARSTKKILFSNKKENIRGRRKRGRERGLER